MSRLVLQFSQAVLQLLTAQEGGCSTQQIPLDNDKPFARERMSEPIQAALQNASLGACLWSDTSFTLFPRDLFDPTQLEAYYTLNHGQASNQQHLLQQTIPNLDLVFIFSAPVWLYDFTKYELQQPLQHSIAQQLQFCAQQNPVDQVTLFIEAQHFVLVTFKNRQLISCTANEFQQQNDILYFLLAQQQKLQLTAAQELLIYDATAKFDSRTFEQTLHQFKDFEKYACTFFDTPTYQNSVLCASFEEH